ncbi:uncharacterized protein LOC117168547 [Belonocnema kinseyi]|uniref:uncharacterized protein LOC117168547 n=1 Tax=Belonocnema kinseyi TaxID=2817044 RepID=UPI00143D2ED4|nr:uncharacterized protein LOC117168547 [Belonocnema kinseyi]
MSGLLNGPFCQFAEATLENVCDRVPLGKAGFKAFKAVKSGVINYRKFAEEEKIRIKYKNIEAHIEGACKVLKPVMELKNILNPESKSADRAKPGLNPSASLNYYTPQKPSNECHCAEGIRSKDFSKETQFERQMREKENSKSQGSLKREKKLSTDSDSDLDSECYLKSKNNVSWKKCDACQAVSKFLIRTTCDHEICQKCVNSGKDCQTCFDAAEKMKNEPKKKLYPQLVFDID